MSRTKAEEETEEEEKASRWEERVGYESGLQHYHSSLTPKSHCYFHTLHLRDKMVENMEEHLAVYTLVTRHGQFKCVWLQSITESNLPNIMI